MFLGPSQIRSLLVIKVMQVGSGRFSRGQFQVKTTGTNSV